MKLILGSQSPRRQEILSHFKIPYQQVSPHFDESSIPFEGDASHYVALIAKKKGECLVPKHPDIPILTADTIVYKDGKVYPKPRDINEAAQFLRAPCGQWHDVLTAVVITHNGDLFEEVTTTRVLLNNFNEEQIQHYHSSISFADKAGAYAIQGMGYIICNKIEGCYYNVMGLPINSVISLLRNVGIETWNYLPKNTY